MKLQFMVETLLDILLDEEENIRQELDEIDDIRIYATEDEVSVSGISHLKYLHASDRFSSDPQDEPIEERTEIKFFKDKDGEVAVRIKSDYEVPFECLSTGKIYEEVVEAINYNKMGFSIKKKTVNF